MVSDFKGISAWLMGIKAGIAAVVLIIAIPTFAAPRQMLSHHVPEAVGTAPQMGRLSGDKRLTLSIGLPWRNREALTNLMEQLYDPASPNYHHFKTAEEFTALFGPTVEDYEALKGFAAAHGLTVKREHSNRMMLTVEGAVADIEQTFQVKLHNYKHPTENRMFFAPDVEPSVELGVAVLGISGLDNFAKPHPMSLHPTPANAVPQGGTYTGGFFIGNDFRKAYVPGVNLTGAGQTVGLLEFDDYFPSDIAAYEAQAGLPNVPLTNVYVTSFTGPPGDGVVEVSLDIEMAISMAPGLSKVIVYEAGPNGTGDEMLNVMAESNQPNQLSSSWTFGIDQMTEQDFQEFQIQGQSFYNASGDNGAYSNFQRAPTPVDDPLIIIVGGTTLTTTANGAWASEKAWNWYNTGVGVNGTGGGVSAFYSIPTWQQGMSVVANLGSTKRRNLPDVAMTADNIVVFYGGGSVGSVGGTSCAAPLWAAFTALINQRQAAAGQPTIGFINPAVYAIGKTTSFLQDFHDITTGNNTNLTSPSKFPAVAGYDLCTGWGTPNGANMIFALAPGLPIITAQPVGLTALPGTNVTLSVSAVGGVLSYQWQFNSNNIAGATSASFTITNAQPTNSGIYAVIVSNSSGAITSSNASLTVSAPPLITGQPQNLTVPAGSNALFSVNATATPPVSYQWKFNGTNISSATDSNFTLVNAQFTNQGNYSVLVSNSGGAVLSSNAFLTVQTPPRIATQPVSRAVGLSNVALFAVSATGSTTLAYQWLFFGAPIPGATNTSFGFTHAAATNIGDYSVFITNNFGAITSQVATLSITNLPPAFNSQPLPTTVNAIVGDTARFTVVPGTGLTNLTYQWLINSNPVPVNSRITGSQSPTLAISNVVVSDAGNYSVLISNPFGSLGSSNAVLNVLKATPQLTWATPAGITYGTALGGTQLNASANQPGVFTYNPPSGTVLDAGTKLVLAIFTPTDFADYNSTTTGVNVAVSTAPLTVTASNATRIYGAANPTFTASVSGALNGDAFTASANSAATTTNLPGQYPIIPSVSDPGNRLGNYSVSLVNGTLTVTPAAPPTITSITPNTGPTNGGTAISIIGTGFEVGATVNFGALAAASVTVTNATNVIAMTPSSNPGVVNVLLTNADGLSVVVTNGFTFVDTNSLDTTPPNITGEPTNQIAGMGGSAAFTVIATGATPLNYQWFLNNTNIASATNSTFAISNILPLHAGIYEAVVSNSFGVSTSTVATLSVLGSPVYFLNSPDAIRYSNGQVILQITGLTGQGPVIIESSPDLRHWSPIFTNPSGFGQIQFIDTSASVMPANYYRAKTPAGP